MAHTKPPLSSTMRVALSASPGLSVGEGAALLFTSRGQPWAQINRDLEQRQFYKETHHLKNLL